MPGKRWVEDEVSVMATYWQTETPIKKICQMLPQRTTHSIYHMARRLELKRPRKGVERPKISEALTGRKRSKEFKEKWSRIRMGWGAPFKGHHHAPKTKKLLSKEAKTRWSDYKYASEMLKKIHSKPSKNEGILIKLLEKHGFPFKYVGDGSFMVGRLNPDFVNEDETKLIEVFSRAFHDPDTSFRNEIPWHQQYWGRMAYYAQFGYDCLILWDGELRDEAEVVEKIIMFMG